MGGYARERTARRYTQSFDHYRHQNSHLQLNVVRILNPSIWETVLLDQKTRWSNVVLGAFAVHVPCCISIFITIIFDAIQYAGAIRFAHEFSKYYPLIDTALRPSIQLIFDSPWCCDIAECVRGSKNIGDYPLQG
jgi:hypothetical protein